MDAFFQNLVGWIAELVELRYGRTAGCIAVIVGTALFLAGVWLVIIWFT